MRGQGAADAGRVDDPVAAVACPAADTVAAGAGKAADPVAAVAGRAANIMGERAVRDWPPHNAVAWEGLLDVATALRRRGEAAIAEHGVSLGMLGVMGRLLRADGMTLRESAIAADMGRSLSRVSRLVDTLEARGLVRRAACPADRRATDVTLAPAGAELTRSVQGAVHDFVRASFFDELSDADVETLAAVFARLIRAGAAGTAAQSGTAGQTGAAGQAGAAAPDDGTSAGAG